MTPKEIQTFLEDLECTDKDEGYCPDREDQTHCVHWWDDAKPCCNCGWDSPEVEERYYDAGPDEGTAGS